MSTQYEVSLSDTRLTDDELVDWLIVVSSRYGQAKALKADRETLDVRWRMLDHVQQLLLDRLAAYRETAP